MSAHDLLVAMVADAIMVALSRPIGAIVYARNDDLENVFVEVESVNLRKVARAVIDLVEKLK